MIETILEDIGIGEEPTPCSQSELMEAALIKPLGETPTPVLKNCYLAPRQRETMFFKTADAIIPNLDGYAIIPREDYEKLRVLAGMELTSPHP